MSFEISTFEYSDLYDGIDTVKPEEVLEKFIQQYKRHLSPEYYPEDMVWFSRGRTWIAYSDKTGGDKPKMVMLMGPITDELIAQIKDAVAKLYINFCRDCFKVLSKERARKWAVCHECANA
jgi:hypothetical protein